MHPTDSDMQKSDFPFEVGSIVFDRFEVIDRLGSGGMGDVFEVRDINLDKRLALKVLSEYGDAEAVVRFQNEARITSHLSHPNIATVFDFGISKEGKPYLAIELIEGTSLQDYVDKNGCLTMSQFFDIFIDVTAALECAHREGVVHRDLKPANIMVNMKAEGKHAMVLDFGIAKRVDIQDSKSGKLTITGQVIGTPLFMSPEQASGNSATSASDLYSLGCIMYFCMAGRPPLKGKTVLETLDLHVNSNPEPLLRNKNKEDLPPPISCMIAKLLDKDPKQRFDDVSQVKAELIALKKMLETYAKNIDLPMPTAQRHSGRRILKTVGILLSVSLCLLAIFCFCVVVSRCLPEPSKSGPHFMGDEFPNKRGDKEVEKVISDKDLQRVADLRNVKKTESGISRPSLLKLGMSYLKSGNYTDAILYFRESAEDKDISTKKQGFLGLIECNIAVHNYLEAKVAEKQYLDLIDNNSSSGDQATLSTSSRRSERTKFQIEVGDLYFSYGRWLFAKRKYDEVLATQSENLTRQERSRVNTNLSVCKQNLRY